MRRMKTLLDRLDDLQNNMGSAIYEDADTCGEAADKLRHLQALNADLVAELNWMRQHWRKKEDNDSVAVLQNCDGIDVLAWIDRVDAVLRKAEAA